VLVAVLDAVSEPPLALREAVLGSEEGVAVRVGPAGLAFAARLESELEGLAHGRHPVAADGELEEREVVQHVAERGWVVQPLGHRPGPLEHRRGLLGVVLPVVEGVRRECAGELAVVAEWFEELQ